MKSEVKYSMKLAGAAAFTALLTGCGSFDGVDDNLSSRPAPPVASGSSYGEVSDFPVKIGEPYQIDGKTYTPEDVASYDDVGYASWYGQELAGNPTANGEPFNPMGITAAHKTLPLPSYVQVTALDTGRTILVRINDRGPFASDRILDLSQGAARQLGLEGGGVAGVRVRKVNPNEQERAVLRSGGMVTERIATPDSLLTILRNNLAKLPKPKAPVQQAAAPIRPAMSNTPAPNTGSGRFIVEGAGAPPSRQPAATARPGATFAGGNPSTPTVSSSGDYVVQVAAFGSKSRADAMARKIGARVMPSSSGNIYRVRYGPYDSANEAQAGLAQAKKRGYSAARILRAD